MTKAAYPVNGSDYYESSWDTFMGSIVGNGVLASIGNNINELQVYGDSSGMQVKVRAGAGFVNGCYFSSDAEVTLAISASHATYNRYDLVVLEADYTITPNNATTFRVDLKVVAGTPSGSPAIPALTQTTNKWQVALALVSVDATVVTIAAGKVADWRPWALGTVSLPFQFGSGASVPVANSRAIQKIDQGVYYKVVAATIEGDASGSAVVDIWRDTYTNHPPTIADTIVSSAKPTLSTAVKAYDIALSGWNREIDARNDAQFFIANLDSCTTCKWVLVTLKLARVPNLVGRTA